MEMIQLTKEEKHELYSSGLKELMSGSYIDCCCAAMSLKYFDLFKSSLNVTIAKIQFPELFNLRTKEYSAYWFNNKQERIEALKKCIELTK